MTELIRTAVAPPPRPRRATKPSRASKERRLEVKRQRSDLKRGRRQKHDDS
jgi:ribosome-associated protein